MSDDLSPDGALPIPHLHDMQAMLRIACRLHELPAPRRTDHLLRGVRELIDAVAWQAWRIEGPDATPGVMTDAPKTGVLTAGVAAAGGSAIGGVALSAGAARSANGRPTTRLGLEDDPAVSLLARSTRRRTPVVRFRDELIERETWRQAVRHALPPDWHDGLYSLHHDPKGKSLLAFYRARGNPWGERERGIVHLLHAQGGWVMGE